MDDFLIIGSGFGGAVAAHELTQAGAKVTLIERGPWRDTLPMRSSNAVAAEQLAPLPQGRHFFSRVLFRLHHPWLPRRGLQVHRQGLLEAFNDRGIRVVCASGVGGGSHAYGGLHAGPLRPDYWDNHADDVDSQCMGEHQTAMLQLFGSPPAPQDGDGQRPAIVRQPWEQQAHPFVEVPSQEQPHWGYLLAKTPGQPQLVTQNGITRQECDFTQEGMFGSPAGAKLTLDVACLLPALRAGLTLHAGLEVQQISRATRGFSVNTLDLATGQTRTLRAHRVILAAGAINSVALLLRSRASGGLQGMPALGQGLATNGDVMAWFAVNTPGANHPAAGIYQRLYRHRDDVDDNGRATGPLLLQTGLSGLSAVPLMPPPLRRRLQRDLFIATMGGDAADGRITLQDGRLRLDYDKRNSPVFARIETHLAELRALSGKPLRAADSIATVHPLGGACLGHNPADSVVNGRGEVHDIPGLFITDASALPAALGSPPSLSIAAWSRHVAQGLSQAE